MAETPKSPFQVAKVPRRSRAHSEETGRASTRTTEPHAESSDIEVPGKTITDSKVSEEELRRVIDTIPAMAWCALPDGTKEFLNKQWHDYMGLPPEESDGWGWTACVHPEDLSRLLKEWHALMASGEQGETEARLRRRDGTFRWFLIRGQPLRDAAGKIVRWYGTTTDIETLKQAEVKLREDERELRRMTDAIAQAIIVLNPDGQAVYANRVALEYLGLSLDEVRAEDFRTRVFHPEDLQKLSDGRRRALSGTSPFENEQRVKGKDGRYRWFLIRYNPFPDEHGKVGRWYATGTDIEDRKQAENKLRQDERELRELIDFLPQHVIVLDKDGTLLQVNQTMLDYKGCTLHEMKGGGTVERMNRDVHPDDVERVKNERTAGFSRHDSFEIEKRMLGKDGRYRWFLFRYKPVLGEDAQIVRWFATATDIEDRKHDEDKMRNENTALREEIVRSSMLEEIVGSSAAIREVLEQVAKVAPTDSTVLIEGETGTGKELVARAIHHGSQRANRAFIRVNCAAVPQGLLASELFGHEQGAFTGALQRRMGRFEAAEGGTILLDEVGELPLETQAALLHVLQNHEFERVGGNQSIPVDVRVLVATSQDLAAAADDGTFRKDLFYRLNIFPIHLPALRDRAEDIPLLVEYLVERYASKARKKMRGISKETVTLFQNYQWPGNIRELQNVIERAVILSDSETFSVNASWLASLTPGLSKTLPLASDLAKREKAMIENALREAQGRISGPAGAAAKLGLPRQTLESKIKRLGIKRYKFKIL